MKNVFYLLCLMFITSCSNGLNKPLIETLTVEELQANMKGDSTFTDFYKETQRIRAWILESDINQAKYGSITYERLRDFEKEVNDTTFSNRLTENWRKEYDLLYPNYQQQIDSIKNYWRKYKEDNKLESYVNIEFDKLWKEYYSYSGDVKEVNVGFKITPLRGTIDQLIFRYDIKSKISNSKSIGVLDGKRCLASSPIRSSQTLYWEADYSDEKYLKNMSNTEVKRDYNFIIEIVEVRVNGENLHEKIEAIPYSVNMALKYGNDGFGDLYNDDIIKEFINDKYQTFHEFTEPKFKEEIRKIDKEVFDLMKDFSERKDK